MRTARLGIFLFALLLTPSPGSGDEPVTFSNQIVRIFQQHCQACHRLGDIAPFSLTTYRDAYPWREQIREATRSRKMPPWKPVPGHGEFADMRRLAEAEIALIARWVDAGAPEGDPRDLPPPKMFPTTWALGEPDLVLTPAEAFSVAGGGGDLYRCFTIPTNFTEDRYVSAVEIRPGNRKIVHHVLTFLDTAGHSVELDRAEPGLGYTCFGGPGFFPRGGLGGWAPGARPLVMPERVGMLLPAGSHVVIQVHYHPAANPETDRTAVGVHFAKGPIDKRVRAIPILNRQFVIPAGAPRHEVHASFTLPPGWNLHAIGISPHMHLLGREMQVTAAYPDGTVRPLIWIDDWDFNWQGSYTFAKPVPLPGGTRIDVRAVFDNSAGNPRNPNSPPKDVRWGEATTDEMCIAFLRITVDAESLNYTPR